jgi:tellurite resistance protein
MSTEHLATLIEEELQPSLHEPPSAILRASRPVRLTNRQKDLVRSLACVMWADGNASPQERRIVEQIIDELGPSKDERIEMNAWLEADCSTLEDVNLEHLSPDEKQVLLTHAVVLAMADDVQLPTEKAMLATIIERIALPAEVVRTIFEDAREDGAVSLPGSAMKSVPPLPHQR